MDYTEIIYNSISLFSGLGGDSLGITQAGCQIIAYNELKPVFCNSHDANFPDSERICDGKINDISKLEDSCFEKYNGKTDMFWKILHNKYDVNVNRKLKIYTYGTNKSLPSQKGCQMIFDASILRGNQVNITEKTLLKMRGTNLILQQVIRTSLLFNGFINDIVENIEKNDYSVISIICKAGHHRSVACAEMLKNLYQNCTTTHLTIDL